MSTQVTQEPRTLAQQMPAAEALVGLTKMLGHLPAPYVVVHSTPPVIALQLNTPSEFETWRTALQLAPDTVTLHAYVDTAWLAADTVFRGVEVHLTGHGLPLTLEQAETVQEPLAVSA